VDKLMKGDITPFAKQMKKLVNHKDSSDIKFLIGPDRKPIYAHQCFLSTRCEVFRAMFTDKEHKNKAGSEPVPFVLSDTNPEVFSAMLEYIYTNCVTLNAKTAIDELGMSIEYGLDGLRELCVDYLIEQLSVGTACEALQAAVTYGQDRLTQKAMQYIEANTQNTLKSKGFHEVSDAAMGVILSSDGLMMDEKEILDCVREWATVSSVVLNKSKSAVAKNVIRHLRLPLLSAEELTSVEEENKVDSLIPIDHISFAWKCHALKTVDAGDKLLHMRKGTVQRECHKTMSITEYQEQ